MTWSAGGVVVGVALSCDVLHTMAVCSSVLRSCHFPRHLVPPPPPPPPFPRGDGTRFGHLAVELLAQARLPLGQADINQGPVKLGSGCRPCKTRVRGVGPVKLGTGCRPCKTRGRGVGPVKLGGECRPCKTRGRGVGPVKLEYGVSAL